MAFLELRTSWRLARRERPRAPLENQKRGAPFDRHALYVRVLRAVRAAYVRTNTSRSGTRLPRGNNGLLSIRNALLPLPSPPSPHAWPRTRTTSDPSRPTVLRYLCRP